jgi:Rad3-related DNA helicase
MEFAELKIMYENLAKKHNLPSFDEMNSIFEIGRIEINSGNLIKDVRKFAIEKISHYVRLIEIMLNPSQASPMFLMLLREINSKDKKIIEEVFSALIELEISSYYLDIESTESKEVESIKKIYSVWLSHKKNLTYLVEILERNSKLSNNQKGKSKDYFN